MSGDFEIDDIIDRHGYEIGDIVLRAHVDHMIAERSKSVRTRLVIDIDVAHLSPREQTQVVAQWRRAFALR